MIPVPAVTAAGLALLLAAVPSGAGTEVAWWLRLLFDVPTAVAAVAAAVVSSHRVVSPVTSGLAAAGGVLVVGPGAAAVLCAAPGMSVWAALSRVPTQAALALLLVGLLSALTPGRPRGAPAGAARGPSTPAPRPRRG